MPTLETSLAALPAPLNLEALLEETPPIVQDRPTLKSPALIQRIALRSYPVHIEGVVAPFAVGFYALELSEGRRTRGSLIAYHDLDLRVRDRFGAIVAEYLRDGALSQFELTPLGSGEFVLEVISRSDRETSFSLLLE